MVTNPALRQPAAPATAHAALYLKQGDRPWNTAFTSREALCVKSVCKHREPRKPRKPSHPEPETNQRNGGNVLRVCAKVEKLAQAVIDARNKFGGSTLVDLYDADVMKPELRRAHRALDLAVDSLYRRAAFHSDRDRVEHLWLYEKLVTPLRAAGVAAPKRRARKRSQG
jgi:hypothetical protein